MSGANISCLSISALLLLSIRKILLHIVNYHICYENLCVKFCEICCCETALQLHVSWHSMTPCTRSQMITLVFFSPSYLNAIKAIALENMQNVS